MMEEKDPKDNEPSVYELPEEITSEEEESPEKQAVDELHLVKELNDKYLRCYAEFDNYKKRVSKEKQDLLHYANESLMYELLPAIDSLELALKHASDNTTGIVQGVVMTLKEIHRTLEKFGLSKIPADGKKFDPTVHHAMMNVERDDMEEKMVAEELRSGYTYRDKVLRPSLVAVSAKPQAPGDKKTSQDEPDNFEIKINKDTEEE